MKMDRKKIKETNRFKKLSDYIMTFAFLYSSLICFSEAAELWEKNKMLAVLILICGGLSFLAVFRWQIAKIIYFFLGKKSD